MPTTIPTHLDDYVRELFTLLPIDSPADFAPVIDILTRLPSPEERCNAAILGLYYDGDMTALEPVVNIEDIGEVKVWLEEVFTHSSDEQKEYVKRLGINGIGVSRFLYTINQILGRYAAKIEEHHEKYLRYVLARNLKGSHKLSTYGYTNAQWLVHLHGVCLSEQDYAAKKTALGHCEDYFFKLWAIEGNTHLTPDEEKESVISFDYTIVRALNTTIQQRLGQRYPDMEEAKREQMSIRLVHFFTAIDLILYGYACGHMELYEFYRSFKGPNRGLSPGWSEVAVARTTLIQTYHKYLDELKTFMPDGKGDEVKQQQYLSTQAENREHHLNNYLNHFKASKETRALATTLTPLHRQRLLMIMPLSFFFLITEFDTFLVNALQDKTLAQSHQMNRYLFFFYLFFDFNQSISEISLKTQVKLFKSLGDIIRC